MLGIVMCNASSIVAPWQAREPVWGTNPICVSVPGGGWLLDMATTTVAMGKIYKAGVNKQPEIPAGWAMDSDGVPTTSTEAALRGMLMPLGGLQGQRSGNDGRDSCAVCCRVAPWGRSWAACA
jgi:LDH2 family malate/lactate/ureidoglycolate dehydrogenase